MKEDFSLDVIFEQFTQYLEKNKLRKTPERFAVIKKVFQTEGFFEIEQLYNALKTDYRVSLATVYNTIEHMIQANLLIKHQFPGNSSKYEKHFNKQNHYYLICTKCGSIKEFSDLKIKNLIKMKSFTTFEPGYHSLNLFGLCSRCNPKSKKKINSINAETKKTTK